MFVFFWGHPVNILRKKYIYYILEEPIYGKNSNLYLSDTNYNLVKNNNNHRINQYKFFTTSKNISSKSNKAVEHRYEGI